MNCSRDLYTADELVEAVGPGNPESYVVFDPPPVFFVFFVQIGQNGRPGRREAFWSASFDKTSRMKSVRGRTQKLLFVFACGAR